MTKKESSSKKDALEVDLGIQGQMEVYWEDIEQMIEEMRDEIRKLMKKKTEINEKITGRVAHLEASIDKLLALYGKVPERQPDLVAKL